MDIPEGGIGFFDSGLGGLTVLSACLDGLGLPVCYYGDNARAPYGGLPEEKILAYAEEAFDAFSALRVRAAVIACNTVTAVCADRLREKYPFPVVGAEPAVRVAARRGGRIFVLVTPATAQSGRFLSLCGRVGREFPAASISVCPCPELAGWVERSVRTGEKIPLPSLLPSGKPDAVVLGCTHYVFLREEIGALYGCPVFDGNEGIARELFRVLSSRRACGRPLAATRPSRPPLLTTAAAGKGLSEGEADGFSRKAAEREELCFRFGEKTGKGEGEKEKNIRSRIFCEIGQKRGKKGDFSEIFFLGSGKTVNKSAYEQMFAGKKRGTGSETGSKIPKS